MRFTAIPSIPALVSIGLLGQWVAAGNSQGNDNHANSKRGPHKQHMKRGGILEKRDYSWAGRSRLVRVQGTDMSLRRGIATFYVWSSINTFYYTLLTLLTLLPCNHHRKPRRGFIQTKQEKTGEKQGWWYYFPQRTGWCMRKYDQRWWLECCSYTDSVRTMKHDKSRLFCHTLTWPHLPSPARYEQSNWCGKQLVVSGNGKTATVTVAGDFDIAQRLGVVKVLIQEASLFRRVPWMSGCCWPWHDTWSLFLLCWSKRWRMWVVFV